MQQGEVTRLIILRCWKNRHIYIFFFLYRVLELPYKFVSAAEDANTACRIFGNRGIMKEGNITYVTC